MTHETESTDADGRVPAADLSKDPDTTVETIVTQDLSSL